MSLSAKRGKQNLSQDNDIIQLEVSTLAVLEGHKLQIKEFSNLPSCTKIRHTHSKPISKLSSEVVKWKHCKIESQTFFCFYVLFTFKEGRIEITLITNIFQ